MTGYGPSVPPCPYHYRVPRDVRQNVLFRRALFKHCSGRKDSRDRRAALLHMCERDPLFWINAFVWQYNPNTVGACSLRVGPFSTWPFQDRTVLEIMRCVRERRDLVIEKSREMGASWMALLVMGWYLLFRPDTSFLCISRNKESVDDASRNSLFTKLDYVFRHLPEWMCPMGPGGVIRQVMSFVNEANGSEISGQATTAKAGVGGRATAIFVDEFAKIGDDWKVLAHTASTSGCRIFNSTHEGTDTAFFDLCNRAGSMPEGPGVPRKLVLHWSDHPDKIGGAYHYDRETQRVVYHDPKFRYPLNWRPVTDGSPTGGPKPGLRSPWYDGMCQTIGQARGVAADLDINPSGTAEQAFDPLMIADLKARFCRPGTRYALEWVRDSAEPVRLHPDPDGPIHLWVPIGPDGLPPPGRYAFGADVATGTGATPSCLCGADADTGVKVFEYADAKIEPKEFAFLAVAVCRLFATADGAGAKFAWETPGPGNTVTKHVMALRYTNVYRRKAELRIGQPASELPGWGNSPESVRSLLEEYRSALRDRRFLNRSEFALSECLAFVYGPDGYVSHNGWKDPKDPSAARQNHGDRVIADALCWKLCSEFRPGTGGAVAAAATAAGFPPPAYDPRGLAGRRALDRIESASGFTRIR